jgi:hypothetical protein
MNSSDRFTAAVDVNLRDASGAPARFSDLWRQRTTVFLFLRHFG